MHKEHSGYDDFDYLIKNSLPKKKKRRIRYGRILILLCIIFGTTFVLTNEQLNKTKTIIINGNVTVTDDEVLELTKLKDYPHFLFFNKSEAKSRLMKNEMIKKVSINKTWFKTIEIDIEEYNILCYSEDGKYKYLGDLKKYETKNQLIDAPTLLGEIPQDYLEGLLKELDKVDSSVLSLISEIGFLDNEIKDRKFIFYMRDGNTVYIYLNGLGEKLGYYPNMATKLGDTKGVIEFFEFEMRSSFKPYDKLNNGEAE